MSTIKKILALLVAHKYATTIVLFLLLIGYLDSNSLYNRYKLYEEEAALQEEIDKYTEQYNNDTKLYKELMKDPNAAVRIAREKFYMKNENEDVYIFEDETTE